MTIINECWKGPLRELGGTGRHDGAAIGEDDPRPYLETDAVVDSGYLIVGFDEYLNFATDNDDIPAALLEEGWLTNAALPRVREAIAEILKERSGLAGEVIETLSVDDVSGDEPGITIEITIPVDDPRTVEEVFENVMNSFWASMINMADPGTFNWPYLWGRLT